MIAWAQLGIHDKPVLLASYSLSATHLLKIHVVVRTTVVKNVFTTVLGAVLQLQQVGLLNVDGYYNSLLSFIDKAVEEEFISPTARHIIVLAPTPKELLDKLEVTYPLTKRM